MQATAEKLGKYEITLGNAELEKRVAGAVFHQSLDEVASFRVTLATTAHELSKWRASSMPLEASLTLGGKGVFRGALLRAETAGFSRVELHYVDALQGAAKRSTNQLVKQQRLQDCLQRIAEACGLSARFCGNFSEPLPGFAQGGTSLLALLSGLADKHGFHFVSRSAQGQIVFLRAGQSIDSATLDVSTQATHVGFSQSAGEGLDKAQFRYFDSKSGEARQTVLSADDLYADLSAFTGDSSFRDRRGWKTGGGHVETHFTDRLHFDNGRTLLAGQLAKRAMGQEGLSITVHEAVALPGDKVKLSNAAAPSLHEGTYLVAGMSVDIGSVLPRVNLNLMRP